MPPERAVLADSQRTHGIGRILASHERRENLQVQPWIRAHLSLTQIMRSGYERFPRKLISIVRSLGEC